jgi:hypothetical protein
MQQGFNRFLYRLPVAVKILAHGTIHPCFFGSINAELHFMLDILCTTIIGETKVS